jgi:hypothetical protein
MRHVDAGRLGHLPNTTHAFKRVSLQVTLNAFRRYKGSEKGFSEMSILNYRVSTDENLQPLTGKSWKEWCDLFDDWEEETNNLSTISMFRCFSEAEAWD